MRTRKLLTAGAFVATLAGGGVAGAMLGTPGVSGAQETETTTAVEAPDGAEQHGLGRHCHRIAFKGAILETAAETLGLTEEELRAELREGRTLAEVAEEQGIAVETLVDAIVAEITTRIDQAVADGDIDAERAGGLKEGLDERVTERVENGPRLPGRGLHGGHRFGPGPGTDEG